MTDIIDRLRKAFRSLDGVVVVSPKLLEEAAKEIESLREKAPVGVEYRILPKKWEYRSKSRYYQDEKQFEQNRRHLTKNDNAHAQVRDVGPWREHEHDQEEV